ncbi:bifunctional nuclease family protein [bacterium]|nr:MAG: bifunctional nuclease family protein [bacterium]
MSETKLLEVSVQGIALDHDRSHPVVLLKTLEDEEVLPIWIGTAEATAIFTVLAGRSFERPMTHDLLKIIIDVLGARVGRIEITGIQNDTYFARIILNRGEDVFYIDARPSDSIALALRARAPLFIDKELFDKYKRRVNLGEGEDDIDDGLDDFESNDFDEFEF